MVRMEVDNNDSARERVVGGIPGAKACYDATADATGSNASSVTPIEEWVQEWKERERGKK